MPVIEIAVSPAVMFASLISLPPVSYKWYKRFSKSKYSITRDVTGIVPNITAASPVFQILINDISEIAHIKIIASGNVPQPSANRDIPGKIESL